MDICDVESLKKWNICFRKNDCLQREICIKSLIFYLSVYQRNNARLGRMCCYHVNFFKQKINKSLWINMVYMHNEKKYSFLWQFPMTHTNHYLCCRPSSILNLMHTNQQCQMHTCEMKAIDGNCDSEKLKRDAYKIAAAPVAMTETATLHQN